MAYSNSSRALAFLTETSEDAIAALKGLVGGAGSAKYLDTSEDKVSLITSQIDSSRDEDRIHGLTRIVAMISKGRDASHFLPGVLKLTSCTNMDVRKLVYIILLRYGNSNPDLTLLSINSFQRDLSDPSPLIRAMALRVLSAIKVRMVAGIVLMAVTKAVRDPNLYVRKIAALAIPKCYDLDRTQLASLQESLSTLLSDRSPLVLGAALSAFQDLCPDRWDLLHPHYRKICHALSDIDEWGQITALEVLLRYARANFVEPVSASKDHGSGEERGDPDTLNAGVLPPPAPSALAEPKVSRGDSSALETFLASEGSTSTVVASSTNDLTAASPSVGPPSWSLLDRDLELLLAKSEPLLHSRNPAVVMAVVRLVYYLAPAPRHAVLARPIVRLMRSEPEVVYLVLINALSIAKASPDLLAPFVTAFFLGPSHVEPTHVSMLKLDMLTVICNRVNVALVLPEVATHVRSPSDLIATHAVGCLGGLAAKLPDDCRPRCLAALLDLLRQKQRRDGAINPAVRDVVIAKAVLVIKDLVHDQTNRVQDATKTASIVLRLAALLFGAPPKSASSSNAGTAADPSAATTNPATKRRKPKVIGKGAIHNPAARASILWLLGQNCRETVRLPSSLPGETGKTLAELVLPDILRRCAVHFANEASIVKLQILTVSTKVFAFLPSVLAGSDEAQRLMEAVTKVHFYLLRLARYDLDFDVRDRARLCKGLVAGLADVAAPAASTHGSGSGSGGDAAPEILEAVRRATKVVGEWTEDDANLKGVRLRREQVVHILFEGKALPSEVVRHVETNRTRQESHDAGDPASRAGPSHVTAALGSLSLALDGKLIRGWHATSLPAWASVSAAPSPSVREPPPLPSHHPSGTTTPTHPLALSTSALANARSFSSADFLAPSTSGGKVVLVPLDSAASSPQPGAPNRLAGDGAREGRYKDLDAFLEESEEEESESESEFEVDAEAREDEEFESSEEEEGVGEVDSELDSEEEEDEEEEEEEGTSAWKS